MSIIEQRFFLALALGCEACQEANDERSQWRTQGSVSFSRWQHLPGFDDLLRNTACRIRWQALPVFAIGPHPRSSAAQSRGPRLLDRQRLPRRPVPALRQATTGAPRPLARSQPANLSTRAIALAPVQVPSMVLAGRARFARCRTDQNLSQRERRTFIRVPALLSLDTFASLFESISCVLCYNQVGRHCTCIHFISPQTTNNLDPILNLLFLSITPFSVQA
jgi:hypothetical protein